MNRDHNPPLRLPGIVFGHATGNAALPDPDTDNSLRNSPQFGSVQTPKVLDFELKCKARKLKNELRKELAQLIGSVTQPVGSVTQPEEEEIPATLN